MAVPPLSHDIIVRAAQELPATACVLEKLRKKLSEPESGVDDACALLKRDMALCAQIIRVSNSALYSPEAAHASLEEAVGCLGFKEVYKIVGMVVARQLLESDLGSYGYSASLLWENTVATALAMESLAQFVGAQPRAAYTAGLMRSLGKTVLNRAAADLHPPTFDPASGQNLLQWEQEQFGCESAAITTMVLRNWQFPEEICEATEHHYHPETASAAGLMPVLLNIAGRIVSDLGLGLRGEDPFWAANPTKMAISGLTEAEVQLSAEETKLLLEECRQDLGAVQGRN